MSKMGWGNFTQSTYWRKGGQIKAVINPPNEVGRTIRKYSKKKPYLDLRITEIYGESWSTTPSKDTLYRRKRKNEQ